MSFSNLYYKRTAATAKACFVCFRPTTTVLATSKTVDFLYTCPGHLTDPNFASQDVVTAEEIAKVKAEWEEKQRRKKEKEKEETCPGHLTDPNFASQDVVTAEEIAKVKAEWEEKQRRKKEKEKEEKAKNNDKKDDKDKEKEKEEKETKDDKKDDKEKKKDESLSPVHEKYILHRDFFAIRQAEHRKLRQVAQTKELAPRLPGVPNGSVG